jgi:hypothetical protein
MVDEIARLEEQIERCRRLAGALTDADLRESLKHLADEYEAQLKRKRRGAGFMLQDGADPF